MWWHYQLFLGILMYTFESCQIYSVQTLTILSKFSLESVMNFPLSNVNVSKSHGSSLSICSSSYWEYFCFGRVLLYGSEKVQFSLVGKIKIVFLVVCLVLCSIQVLLLHMVAMLAYGMLGISMNLYVVPVACLLLDSSTNTSKNVNR